MVLTVLFLRAAFCAVSEDELVFFASVFLKRVSRATPLYAEAQKLSADAAAAVLFGVAVNGANIRTFKLKALCAVCISATFIAGGVMRLLLLSVPAHLLLMEVYWLGAYSIDWHFCPCSSSADPFAGLVNHLLHEAPSLQDIPLAQSLVFAVRHGVVLQWLLDLLH